MPFTSQVTQNCVSPKRNHKGSPIFIIGNHELKGTTINLKEPFAVLRKKKLNQTTEEDGRENKIAETIGVQYEVAGIVKKKLMFDSYPKSIMR